MDGKKVSQSAMSESISQEDKEFTLSPFSLPLVFEGEKQTSLQAPIDSIFCLLVC